MLQAARRFADRCLAELGDADDDDDYDDDEEDGGYEVDDRRIPLACFRATLATDPGGGAALAYLTQWTLPAVAALTRSRSRLAHATTRVALCDAAASMSRSNAHWLHVLLGVELDGRWRVLMPLERRGFDVIVDGVVSNYDLHALLAAALDAHGVAIADNPAGIYAYLRGDRHYAPRDYVEGSWNLYGPGAAAYDLRKPSDIPLDLWVWGEGAPRDVPRVDGLATLLVGPAMPERTWSCSRAFGALRPARTAKRRSRLARGSAWSTSEPGWDRRRSWRRAAGRPCSPSIRRRT